jgi:hypothetical protein
VKKFLFVFASILFLAGCSAYYGSRTSQYGSNIVQNQTAQDDRNAQTAKILFDHKPPYPQDSPWPCFRRDHRNSGNSPVNANYNGKSPWSFKTGKGIFSTPVIDGEETVYFGSADKNFYALNSDGTLKWQFTCGELIDSAAAVSPFSDPYYGPLLVLGGLINKNAKMVAGGTFIAQKYAGDANKRPAGVTVTGLKYSKPTLLKNGFVKASVNVENGAAWNPDEHIPEIVLVNSERLEALSLDYRKLISASKDASGNISSIRLEIPAGTNCL